MSRPFTLEDIDRLGELLAGIPEPFIPMEPDMLDGYLTALALLKNPPRIEDWIGRVYDLEGRSRARLLDAARQAELRTLILARGAQIEDDILGRKPIDPILFDEDEDEEDAPDDPFAALRPFADGFALACESWPELLRNDSTAVKAALVGIFRYESDAQPPQASQQAPGSGEDEGGDDVLAAIESEVAFADLDEALADLAACVQEIAEVTRAADIERAGAAGKLSAAGRRRHDAPGGRRR